MRDHVASLSAVVWLVAAGAAPAQEPKHALFAFVDHFEPWANQPGEIELWVEPYMQMAEHHADADGRNPIHSYFLWFRRTYDGYHPDEALIRLNEVTYRGFGEIEYHLHHGLPDERMRRAPEAAAEVVAMTALVRDVFSSRGALITAEVVPKFRFGFIHGKWALDNSRGGNPDGNGFHRQYCGVNEELVLLKELGAYADFTFPAWGMMEPTIFDSIFYAKDDPEPASYKNPDNITLVEAGFPPSGDLMIIEGPKAPYTNTVIDGQYPATLTRMHMWVGQNVHVIGQDNWVFVKVFTHGLMGNIFPPSDTWNAYFGPIMDQFYTDIEAAYNDGSNWKLHYVSAREMYNIAKAAEAGMTGDPNLYRDFTIKRPANSVILTQNKYRLLSYGSDYTLIEILDATHSAVEFSMKQFDGGAILEESGQAIVDWETSDAAVDLGQFGELHFVDTTPSIFYRARRCVSSADATGDGVVNLDDFAELSNCATGPETLAEPQCQASDLDCDHDVDLRDFGIMQRGFVGAQAE